MPALAEHLGIDVEVYGLSDPSNGIGLMMLYGRIAQELAGRVIPGFMEKSRGKHPREIVRLTREMVDAMKEHGKAGSDLEACRNYLKFATPELAKPGRKSELEKKGKITTEFSRQRSRRRQTRRKGASQKTPLRVVK